MIRLTEEKESRRRRIKNRTKRREEEEGTEEGTEEGYNAIWDDDGCIHR
jgi:hypothetical protein